MNALGSDAGRLSDYVAFAKGSALFDARLFGDAEEQFRLVLEARPASPLRARAALMIARAMVGAGAPSRAVEFVRANSEVIGEPQASALLAAAAQQQSDALAAAAAWQRVYYTWPNSPEATDAEAALPALQAQLGERFPTPSPKLVLDRAARLLDRGDDRRARRDLQDAVARFTGADRELARVRLCAADYVARRNTSARTCLRSLAVKSPEAGAERLYYLMAAARRLDRATEMRQYVRALAKYPKSEWRLEALVGAGNYYQLLNQTTSADRFYRACASAFQSSEDAPYCLWKIAWNAHMRRQSTAPKMFREYAARYPEAEKVPAALYFVGDYEQLARRFPTSYYYGLVASKVTEVRASAVKLDWTENPATAARVDRAQLLTKAGLEDWAAAELRFAARNDADARPNVLALEMARIANGRGMPERGIRAIKSLFPEYNYIPLSAAPDEFWQFAYPMYYRDAIEAESTNSKLDPFFVASVIRQESEYDRTVVSNARAYGLMQLLPSTAAELSRKASVTGYSRDALFDPAINVKLGTYYLRSLIARFGGSLEAALAAYNGGASRVRQWLGWYTYREPAEFIETIPITETRTYVLKIMRDVEIYRRLYSK